MYPENGPNEIRRGPYSGPFFRVFGWFWTFQNKPNPSTNVSDMGWIFLIERCTSEIRPHVLCILILINIVRKSSLSLAHKPMCFNPFPHNGDEFSLIRRRRTECSRIHPNSKIRMYSQLIRFRCNRGFRLVLNISKQAESLHKCFRTPSLIFTHSGRENRMLPNPSNLENSGVFTADSVPV